jgi:membrane protein implicated in regulation of membrane protease activity
VGSPWRLEKQGGVNEDSEEGEEVEVIGVSGVTLEVKRVGGG